MSAIRGIACSRAESMIWERSQAPPENKDSYIHWSAEPRRQLATPASPRLLSPIPCAPSTAEASRCSLALRHPIAARSRRRVLTACHRRGSGRVVLRRRGREGKERIHFNLRARTTYRHSLCHHQHYSHLHC